MKEGNVSTYRPKDDTHLMLLVTTTREVTESQKTMMVLCDVSRRKESTKPLENVLTGTPMKNRRPKCFLYM